MANHASLSRKQAEALYRFLDKHLHTSVDKMISVMGVEDTFTLVRLRERLSPDAEDSSEA